ncbi:hypothetical protein PWG71_25460 [Nocardiopsis sp. N85]|uniref:hypothetical protein n=1 Tax=Nocardiopsis sp. N85 TaxID=3029400 RepID=UPI00237F4C67|nr:hypothetical protein [Nocardiopsis sp. N85]MDE3724748.1 hypothetical protein [Nocardiopsis sp. N85]
MSNTLPVGADYARRMLAEDLAAGRITDAEAAVIERRLDADQAQMLSGLRPDLNR